MAEINWLRMEKRVRDILRLVNQQCVIEQEAWDRLTEEKLRDALTSIDEIIAHETGRGHEISPAGLSGERSAAIQRREGGGQNWQDWEQDTRRETCLMTRNWWERYFLMSLNSPDGNSGRTLVFIVNPKRNPYKGIKLWSWRHKQYPKLERFFVKRGGGVSIRLGRGLGEKKR